MLHAQEAGVQPKKHPGGSDPYYIPTVRALKPSCGHRSAAKDISEGNRFCFNRDFGSSDVPCLASGLLCIWPHVAQVETVPNPSDLISGNYTMERAPEGTRDENFVRQKFSIPKPMDVRSKSEESRACVIS